MRGLARSSIHTLLKLWKLCKVLFVSLRCLANFFLYVLPSSCLAKRSLFINKLYLDVNPSHSVFQSCFLRLFINQPLIIHACWLSITSPYSDNLLKAVKNHFLLSSQQETVLQSAKIYVNKREAWVISYLRTIEAESQR